MLPAPKQSFDVFLVPILVFKTVEWEIIFFLKLLLSVINIHFIFPFELGFASAKITMKFWESTKTAVKMSSRKATGSLP